MCGSADDREFRTKVRSLVFNIKDPKNVGLRKQLLNGSMSGSQLVHMTPHELANPQLQEEYHQMEEHKLKETILDDHLANHALPAELESEKHPKVIHFLAGVGYVCCCL